VSDVAIHFMSKVTRSHSYRAVAFMEQVLEYQPKIVFPMKQFVFRRVFVFNQPSGQISIRRNVPNT
jgi:hypothetical protein